MRKLGWLHAVPEGLKKSRMTSYKEVDVDSTFLKLPDVGNGAYIIGMLHEAGLMSTAGMSVVPLSWQEIDAWIRVTESSPQLWERLLIKEMSEVYVSELNAATVKDRPSPYQAAEEVLFTDREAVANKLLNALRSFGKRAPPTQVEDETEENGSIPPSG